jgi:hypothetical protein
MMSGLPVGDADDRYCGTSIGVRGKEAACEKFRIIGMGTENKNAFHC